MESRNMEDCKEGVDDVMNDADDHDDDADYNNDDNDDDAECFWWCQYYSTN